MTICDNNDAQRDEMTSYWKGHASHRTLEAMMLDSNAATLNELEAPEILAKLPNFEKQDVLELASGIGRYTQLISKVAKTVTAVEFMQEFHDSNVKLHAGQSHVKLLCEDVTKLEMEKTSQDLVFSNWLLMYLGDEEVKNLAKNQLKWLRTGGHLFFRESCFKQSGDATRTSNPTNYRHPAFYVDAFRSMYIQESGPDKEGRCTISFFELLSSSSVNVYRKLKNNSGQVCFLWKKVTKKCTLSEMKTFQQFLDEEQYTMAGIKRYERIFGSGFVSPGGLETTSEFIDKLNLKTNDRVLDVGCGVGGAIFYMVEKYGVSAVGIDLSTNMVHTALERAMEKPMLDIEFEICDAGAKQFEPASFDVIFSRDTLLHVEDKMSLFANFFKWLKPGGQVLITDYCCGEAKPSKEFQDYVAGRGYHLLSPIKYGNVLEATGFENVVVEDRTHQFISILKTELNTTEKTQDAFVKETSQEDYNDIISGWSSKIERCAAGDQRWGFFLAQKPTLDGMLNSSILH